MQIYGADVAAFSHTTMKNYLLRHQVARQPASASSRKQWDVRNKITASRIMKVHGLNLGGYDFSSFTSKIFDF